MQNIARLGVGLLILLLFTSSLLPPNPTLLLQPGERVDSVFLSVFRKGDIIFPLILITKLFVLPNRSRIGFAEPESVVTHVLCGTEQQTSG